VQLVSKISNLCGPDPPTSQTDGQTDGQTTCDRNTALCTILHRVVKKVLVIKMVTPCTKYHSFSRLYKLTSAEEVKFQVWCECVRIQHQHEIDIKFGCLAPKCVRLDRSDFNISMSEIFLHVMALWLCSVKRKLPGFNTHGQLCLGIFGHSFLWCTVFDFVCYTSCNLCKM